MAGSISSVISNSKAQNFNIESSQNSFLSTSFTVQTTDLEKIKHLQIEFSRSHAENKKIVEMIMRLIKNRPQILETPHEISRCIREANPNSNTISKIIVYQNSENQEIVLYISREASAFKIR